MDRAAELPRTAGHPLYERLNELPEEAGCDAFVEERCRKFCAPKMGRPSLAPGVYFRLLLVGYFEGLDSERGMEEMTPDHSIPQGGTRAAADRGRNTPGGVHLGAEGGSREGVAALGIDATTLEANAALRSIVRRDSGESYQEFLTKPAQESGVATPTREDLARLDRKRKRKGSNLEWEHPHDPEARITKMKDGTTHLAHKAGHAVNLETGPVVAVSRDSKADAVELTTFKQPDDLDRRRHTKTAEGSVISTAADPGREHRLAAAHVPIPIPTASPRRQSQQQHSLAARPDEVLPLLSARRWGPIGWLFQQTRRGTTRIRQATGVWRLDRSPHSSLPRW